MNDVLGNIDSSLLKRGAGVLVLHILHRGLVKSCPINWQIIHAYHLHNMKNNCGFDNV